MQRSSHVAWVLHACADRVCERPPKQMGPHHCAWQLFQSHYGRAARPSRASLQQPCMRCHMRHLVSRLPGQVVAPVLPGLAASGRWRACWPDMLCCSHAKPEVQGAEGRSQGGDGGSCGGSWLGGHASGNQPALVCPCTRPSAQVCSAIGSLRSASIVCAVQPLLAFFHAHCTLCSRDGGSSRASQPVPMQCTPACVALAAQSGLSCLKRQSWPAIPQGAPAIVTWACY